MAARTLGSIGTLARSTGPCLLPTLLDPNLLVRLDAVLALGKVDPFSPESVMALAAALDDSNVSVRNAALGGLKRSSRLAAPAVPRLVPMLATPDSELRIQVLGILANVGPAAGSEARAAVHQLTSDPDPTLREKAQTTLIRIDAPRRD
jgi:HEAT repeat protein